MWHSNWTRLLKTSDSSPGHGSKWPQKIFQFPSSDGTQTHRHAWEATHSRRWYFLLRWSFSHSPTHILWRRAHALLGKFTGGVSFKNYLLIGVCFQTFNRGGLFLHGCRQKNWRHSCSAIADGENDTELEGARWCRHWRWRDACLLFFFRSSANAVGETGAAVYFCFFFLPFFLSFALYNTGLP